MTEPWSESIWHFPPTVAGRKRWQYSMLQGQGGIDCATDSRDTGGCLSLYVFLLGRWGGGADLNIYMCAWIKKHKGVQTGREQWSELKRETLTHIGEEPVYLQQTYRVREWNLWYVLKLRSPVRRGEVKCAAPDPTLITSLITNKTKAEQTSICSPAECAMAAFV